MKIIFLTLGDETVASSRTRVFQYLPYLDRKNIIYKILIYTNHSLINKYILYVNLQSLNHILILIKFLMFSCFCNICFIQKLLLPKIYLRLLRLLGKRLVFDFDDTIYIANPAVEESTDFKVKLKIEKRFINTIKLSDLIILENEYTKDYANKYNNNILMITGPIDTSRYMPVKKDDQNNIVTIGWIGSPSTTIYLKMLFPVIKILSEKYSNVRFKFIGAESITIPDVQIKQIAWNLHTEVKELQEFDIGIMPLFDNEWEKGKGGYKILQYMSIGIPSVASPVGINTKIIREKVNGLLAKNEAEWIDKLSKLVDNPGERIQMGNNARKIAEEKYSYFTAAPGLIEYLQKLYHE